MTDTTLSINPRVRFRAVGDEGVLVHIDNGRVVVVNDVGLFLVDQLQQPRSRDELSRAMVDCFNVSPDQAATDLDSYLAELAAEDLLASASTGTAN